MAVEITSKIGMVGKNTTRLGGYDMVFDSSLGAFTLNANDETVYKLVNKVVGKAPLGGGIPNEQAIKTALKGRTIVIVVK